jgi:phosphoglycerate dehydrogenase-like enzyme
MMTTTVPLAPPVMPQRVVIGHAMHPQLAEVLLKRRPSLVIRGRLPGDVTAEDLAWADTYIGFRRPPAAASMGSVRWVHSTGAGVDGWLMGEQPLEAGILLTRSSESFGPAIAEWALARVFAFQQEVVPLLDAQRAGRWAPSDVPRVAGTQALIVGTGDIGRAMARLFAAVGMTVRGVSRSGMSDEPAFTSMHRVDALPELVGDADWIALVLPDTPDTRGVISREILARCRNAVLLNAGRGSVVDESAIPEALDQGWLRGAALDVFTVEPLPSHSPLWRDPRVLISPHSSGPSTVDATADGFLECVDALARGVLPRWTIDRGRGY